MKEVTKDEFKRIYFELGGCRDGWDEAHWHRNFEEIPRPGMKYLVEEPESKDATKMWIVSDYAVNEYRLFFRTQDESDGMRVFPE